MTRMRLALAAAAALAWITPACGGPGPEAIDTTAAVPVVTTPAAVGIIRGSVRASGSIVPAPGAELVVTAPDVARIAELPKANGDHVRRGDLLVRFDIPATAANVAAANAALAQAQARLDAARAARTRAHDLFDRGVSARRDMEDADRELADSEAGVTQAEASLAAATALGERSRRLATFDGIVVARAHNPGDLVDGSNTDVILRVVDPTRLEVVAAVSLADAARVRAGAPARIVSGGAAAESALRVIASPVALDAGAPTVSVRLGFSGPTRGLPGTPVQVEIAAEEHRGVIVVPTSAIVREGDDTSVMVADGAKARQRRVEVGLSDDARTEIRTGLAAGDPVIVQGQAGLPDGADIKTAAGDR